MAGFKRDFNEHADAGEIKPFQGGEDVGEPESSNLPMVIVISLLVLAAFGGVVWVAYNNGVAHGRGDVVAQAAPAAEPQAAAPSNGEMVPPPKPVKAYQQQAGAEDDIPPVAGPIRTADAQAATKPPAQLMPPPAKVEPAKPAPVQSAPPPAKPVAPSAKPAPAPVPQAVPPKPVAKTGSWVLQIGAYTSESDAQAAWRSFQAKHAAVLSGYGFNIQKADLGAKGVWYRLRVTGFSDKDVATATCSRLKAGGGACFPGR